VIELGTLSSSFVDTIQRLRYRRFELLEMTCGMKVGFEDNIVGIT